MSSLIKSEAMPQGGSVVRIKMIMQLKYLARSLACSKCSVNINSEYLPCRQIDTKFESYRESSCITFSILFKNEPEGQKESKVCSRSQSDEMVTQ